TIWLPPQRSPKKRRRRNTRSGSATGASCAAGRAPTCASSPCAACASGRRRSKATSRASRRALGRGHENMTDPISDMLTRIRNGVSAKHTRVDMPASKLKAEIARILQDEGYIQGFRLIEEPADKTGRQPA